MRDIHDAAVVAAEWWAKKIGGEIHHDNGDNSPLNKLAMLMADSAQKKPTEAQINTFKAAVIKGIEEYPYKVDEIDIYCDYGPGLILRDAAEEAGINKMNFPYKTGMYVSEKEVRVKEGYGTPYETIWRKEAK